MERFIDKYVPIRIHLQISDALKNVLPRAQLAKLETFEMQHVKRMNEDLLDDEKNKQLIDICKGLLKELDLLIDKFKKIAKSKGIAYDVKGADSGENLDTQDSHYNTSHFTKNNRESGSVKNPEITIQQMSSVTSD